MTLEKCPYCEQQSLMNRRVLNELAGFVSRETGAHPRGYEFSSGWNAALHAVQRHMIKFAVVDWKQE